MRALISALFTSIILLAPACLPTTSNNFESARMLPPKAVEVQGTGALYFGKLDNRNEPSWAHRTNNYGIAVAYGISSKLRGRFRFDQIILKDRAELTSGPVLPVGSRVHYSELSLKYGWNQRKANTFAAVSLPIGLISYKGGSIWTLAPTVYATYFKNDKFEIGMNGKLHFWLQGPPHYPWFSFGIGAGFSNNLNRWAIRPEIGYDLFNISAGLGFSYIFLSDNPKIQANPR